jgi:hypothetical protein
MSESPNDLKIKVVVRGQGTVTPPADAPVTAQEG